MQNSMVDVMKKVAVDAMEANSPVNIMFATIDKLSPIEITIEQRLQISSAFIVLTETANTNIAAGDKVLVLRQQGGQKYIIIDKVVV